jgi:hypothetical protein
MRGHIKNRIDHTGIKKLLRRADRKDPASPQENEFLCVLSGQIQIVKHHGNASPRFRRVPCLGKNAVLVQGVEAGSGFIKEQAGFGSRSSHELQKHSCKMNALEFTSGKRVNGSFR